MKQNPRPQVAVYYFPNYHVDARNEKVHGPGWTEWELVKAAKPRWKGHALPRTPLWGYTDEADPKQMGQKIAAAADHGVDAFIFDWYWYNDGPYLQRGLDEGYLGAKNRSRVKFALMWANHDWTDIHPRKLTEDPRVLYPGEISRKTFDRATAHVIKHYFAQTSYWRLDDCPYFSIYDLPRLISSFGGIKATARALKQFRLRTRQAGHRDLHLNLVLWQHGILAGERSIPVSPKMLTEFGFDSITSYVWIHHVPLKPFPVMPYQKVCDQYLKYADRTARRFRGMPYFPNVTMGWDASPRTLQTDRHLDVGYPFMGAMSGNTPANFKRALQAVRRWLKDRPANQQIATINAWNEWTEGSYLEPDTEQRLGYLEAIREVFPK